MCSSNKGSLINFVTLSPSLNPPSPPQRKKYNLLQLSSSYCKTHPSLLQLHYIIYEQPLSRWQFKLSNGRTMKVNKIFSNELEEVVQTLGSGSLSQLGSTPQISRPYSAMVRSELNLPDEATFMMAILAHKSWFCKTRVSESSNVIYEQARVPGLKCKVLA